MHPEAAREAIKKKARFYLGLGGLSLALVITHTLAKREGAFSLAK
jgi:hypothetical protein